MSESKRDLRELTVTINTADIPEIRNTIDALVEQIKDKDKQIENLTKYVQTKNRYIDNLEEELAAHEGRVQEQPVNLKVIVARFIEQTMMNSEQASEEALKIMPDLIKIFSPLELIDHKLTKHSGSEKKQD